jgi:hypothetical protein
MELIVKPVTLNSFLSDEDIQKYETSNSILISHSLFEEISNNETYANNMLLLALFRNDIKIFVDIDASHYDDANIMYVPLWIYQHLQCNDNNENINYMQICPKIGNKIKIKPHSDFYAYLPDPVEALRNGFEKYSILVKKKNEISSNNVVIKISPAKSIRKNINKHNNPKYILDLSSLLNK